MLRLQFEDTTDHLILQPGSQRFQSLLQLSLFALVDARPDFGRVEHRQLFGYRPPQPFHDSGVVRRSLRKAPPDAAPRASPAGQKAGRLQRALPGRIELEVGLALLTER